MAAPAVTTVAQVATARRRRGALAALAVGVIVGPLLLILVLVALIATLMSADTATRPDSLVPPAAGARPASSVALDEIPHEYLHLYAQAGAAWGIDWAILAGIGRVECNHGHSQLAGCDPPGTVNDAGARGPMQFLGSTWRASANRFDPDVAGEPIPHGMEHLGYATDASGTGIADPWDPADAIHAAGRYLAHHGAPDDYQGAIFAYNRSDTYVSSVLDHAARYRADPDDPSAFQGNNSQEVPLLTVDCPGGGATEIHAQLMPVVEALYAQSPQSLCGGGYRSTARQIELRRHHCGTSDYAIYQMPASQCSPPTARPGNSMHELGLAIDLTCDGTLITTRNSPCWTWLNDHANSYGLYELSTGAEPWHWSTNGS